MRSNALAAAILAIVCYIAVPHPFCYSLARKQETATTLSLYYQKNDFFLGCDKYTRSIINTSKDIVVFFDGVEQERIGNKDACGEKE